MLSSYSSHDSSMIEGLRGISRKYLPICEFDVQRLKQ